jgi:hypothetical protein
MSSKLFVTLAVFAAVAATGARADEADASQFAIHFDGNRTRAEVMAEAATVSATRSTEPLGSRVAAQPQSSVDKAVVRAEAAEAVRLGRIPHGELGPI